METMTINGEEWVKKSSIPNSQMAELDGMQFVCIRTYSAGVHCGFLKERNGKEVELVNSIRIWNWSGAFTLSELATVGVTDPDNCKFSVVIPSITLTEAIEIIPMTDDAMRSICQVKAYECNN